MEPVDPPKPTGKPPKDMSFDDLTGCLFPWDGLQPVFLAMPSSPHLYLPLFSTALKLRQLMAQAKTPFVSIKQVQDGKEFYGSIREQKKLPNGAEVKVILDPYFLPNGRVRFVAFEEN